jgi:hypothetical protein
MTTCFDFLGFEQRLICSLGKVGRSMLRPYKRKSAGLGVGQVRRGMKYGRRGYDLAIAASMNLVAIATLAEVEQVE